MDRMGYIRTTLFVAAAVAACGQFGCRPSRESWTPTMKNPPIREIKAGKPMGVPDMQPDDIVVAVNGIALTKREVDNSLKTYKWTLDKQKTLGDSQKKRMYTFYGMKLIDTFIATQLVLWDARERIEMDEDEIRRAAESNVVLTAKYYGMTPEKYEKTMPGGTDALRRAVETKLWLKKYTSTCIKPEKATDEKVAEILADIKAQNAVIEASNAVVRARLEKIRDAVVSKGADFGELAEKETEDPLHPEGGMGFWGDFPLPSIEDPVLRRQIAAIPEGDVSGVLEDEEGYMLVKVLRRQRNPASMLSEDDIVTLARVFMRKDSLVVLSDPENIKSEVQEQYNYDAYSKRVNELWKKAQIVYPHGTNFWTTAESGAKAKAKATAKAKERKSK